MEGDITVNDVKISTRDALGIWDTGDVTIFCAEESDLLIVETVINQK